MSAAAVIPASMRQAGRLWRIWRVKLGPVGLLGLMLLVLAAIAVVYVPLLQSESAVLQSEVEALRTQLESARRTARPAGAGQADALRALLPTLDTGTRDLRAVFAAAGRHRVELPKGDYTLSHAEDGSGVARLEVVLPIKERYATIKALLADILNEMPHASLSELRMERSAASANVLEARVRLTLYYRER
ncbi:MAG: putative secretion system transrane protein 2 [Burkholderiaceae bacterium]|nr:putative secretion system transrane protein 2 [Burkholderiaceae bacterium]